MLQNAYGEKCLSRTGVFEWHERFKEGRESLQDDEQKGRPSTSRTEVIQKCLAEDRTLSVRMFEEIPGINRSLEFIALGRSFRKLGPGMFCTTMHRRILRALSPSFWRNWRSPCYPIHRIPLM
jgi:hypothetical protein